MLNKSEAMKILKIVYYILMKRLVPFILVVGGLFVAGSYFLVDAEENLLTGGLLIHTIGQLMFLEAKVERFIEKTEES